MNGTLAIKGKRILENVFFSNYFYGICAVALSVEASLQQRFPLNGVQYFGLIFFITVLYYVYPYIRRSTVKTNNPRTNWYTKHYNLMRWNQVMITVALTISGILFLNNYRDTVMSMTTLQWLLVFIFPVVASAYYGISFLSLKYNIRRIGWLKPFIIGFAWAGLVTVYPVLFYDIIHKQQYEFNPVGVLLFLKNLMFVALLCIMFDIKDYASDNFCRIRTFVVKLGLRKTIFYILFPLAIFGLGAFIWYAVAHHFHPMRILLNVIPFLLLAGVVYSLRKRRSILYYLTIVDGLMLVKAICGTVAITYF
jgi:hypothetical protein